MKVNDGGLPEPGRDTVSSTLHVQYSTGQHRFLDHITKVDGTGWIEIKLREHVFIAKDDVLVLWVKGVTSE